MKDRIEQIMAIIAALQAELVALLAEESAPEPTDDYTAEWGDDGLSVDPGPRGGFLVEAVANLRQQVAAGNSPHRDAILAHPNLNSEYLCQLSGERIASLRGDHPEVWIDYVQNIVLGRLIIPGGGGRRRDADRNLTFRQALDFNAIGTGSVGTLAGVLRADLTATDLEGALTQWAVDALEHGLPESEPEVSRDTPPPNAPKTPGRIPILYQRAGRIHMGTRAGDVFGSLPINQARPAWVGFDSRQWISIPFKHAGGRLQFDYEGAATVEIGERPDMGSARLVGRRTKIAGTLPAGDYFLNLSNAGGGTGWVLVTPRVLADQ